MSVVNSHACGTTTVPLPGCVKGGQLADPVDPVTPLPLAQKRISFAPVGVAPVDVHAMLVHVGDPPPSPAGEAAVFPCNDILVKSLISHLLYSYT